MLEKVKFILRLAQKLHLKKEVKYLNCQQS